MFFNQLSPLRNHVSFSRVRGDRWQNTTQIGYCIIFMLCMSFKMLEKALLCKIYWMFSPK